MSRDTAPLGAGDPGHPGLGDGSLPRSLVRHVRGAPWEPAAISGVLVLVYLPVLLTTYAYSDDYPHLGWWHGTGPATWAGAVQQWAEQGRPLTGLLVEALFSLASTFGELRLVRLFSVVGIVLLGVLLHWALVRAGLGRRWAALAVVFLLTLPAYQVYAAWAVLATAPWAAVLALAGGLTAADALAARRGKALALPLSASAVLLIAALLLYQPAAMVFWVGVAIPLVVPGAARGTWRVLGGSMALAAAALALAYVALLIVLAATGWEVSGRSGLADDPAHKASWVLYIAMPRALGLHYVGENPSGRLALAVVVVLAVGLVLRAREDIAAAARLGAAAAVLVPLAYAPSLVVRENWASFRTQVALSMLLGLYVVVAVTEIGRFCLDWSSRSRPEVRRGVRLAVPALAAAGVTVVAVAAYVNVSERFVQPEARELKVIRSQVAAIPGDEVLRVVFRQASKYDEGESSPNFDEFAFPSSAADWVPEPAVALLLREQGRLGSELTVEVLSPWTELPRGVPAVDMASFED